ncbi:TetR family transcriptional regulator [Corynebacterium sp. SCR221107]|uniref:TetR family transcriptional regulator n=1 Tax=Corynebacterium sp. SCR221107 TaxID=3017361 RepID=UPI0022EC9641|nr:TetR family transcriptional regulator [Corynebacterium sp. SCR221107]WBT09661.1 TetR family transcriptional regulator [Corynebacterium sp. SCR221107]
MSTTPEISLRERKRRQTLADIEDAASRLVAERGFANVTVDNICHEARISKRTFFNYVDSKETAVLGGPPREFTADQRRRLLCSQHDDLVATLLEMSLENVISGQTSTPEQRAILLRRRKHIRRTDPALDHVNSNRMIVVFHYLLAEIVEYFDTYPHNRRIANVAPEMEAAHLALLVTGAIRLGFSRWVDTQGESYDQLAPRCRESLAMLRTLATPPEDT